MEEISWNIWAPVIAAIGSSFVTGASIIAVSYMNKKIEIERAKVDGMMQAAIDSWRFTIETIQKSGKPFTMPPVETFILSMGKASEILFDRTTDESNIEDRLKKSDQFTKKVTDHYYRKSKDSIS